MPRSPSVRAAAASVIAEVLFEGVSLTRALNRATLNVSEKDQALLQELCFGVCRFGHRLSVIAECFLKKPIKAKERQVQALLLLGLYQILHSRIPEHAAISATVEVTKEWRKPWATGLINGVLRACLRATKTDHPPWQTLELAETSHPQWLLERVKDSWPRHWREIIEANNAQGPMTLRVNQQKTSREAYHNQLTAADITATACPHSPHGLTLVQPVAVDKLPLFAEGYASVQDEAAQLSAALLTLEPGLMVLDACAAPGGKACHILETCPDTKLLAIELEPTRASSIHQNLQRLGLRAEVKHADASKLAQWWDGAPFDRILLDAPCSATGVIRRHPDIKWLRRDRDIENLVALQHNLLTSLWQVLKPGGRLVYATCSVLPEENEQTIAHFLETQTDAIHIPIQADWGLARPYGRQLFPQLGGHDGFYYAMIEKHSTPKTDSA